LLIKKGYSRILPDEYQAGFHGRIRNLKGFLLLCYANHSAAQSRACSSCWLTFQVVFPGVNYNTAPDDTVSTIKGEHRVNRVKLSKSVLINRYVTKIANMSFLGVGSAVLCILWVKMSAGACTVKRTAVAILVDVKSVC
jgi:hypothetical protein